MALIQELLLAHKMRAERWEVYKDSQLVVFQIKGEYLVRVGFLALYLAYTQELMNKFKEMKILEVSYLENAHVDVLALLEENPSH